MNEPNQPDELPTRRDFLRSVGRGAAAVGLAAVTIALLGRRAVTGGAVSSAAGRQTCIDIHLPCRDCSELPGCGVPRALLARRGQRRR